MVSPAKQSTKVKSEPDSYSSMTPPDDDVLEKMKNTAFQAEVLTQVLQNIQDNKTLDEPFILESDDDKEEVERWYKKYNKYSRMGGKKSAKDFIDESLLAAIIEYEFEDSYVTDEDIIQYLMKDMTPTDAYSLYEKLVQNVSIDSGLKNGKSKILSLFQSLKENLERNNVSESLEECEPGQLAFPPKSQMQLIMDKLPREFQEKLEVKFKFCNKPKDMRELYKLLANEVVTEVEKSNPTVWGSSSIKDFKTPKKNSFEMEMEALSLEHREKVADAKVTNRMQTRSLTKGL